MIRMNGTPVTEDVKEIPGIIISSCKDLHCWSDEALREILFGSLEVAMELCQLIRNGSGCSKERAKCSRFISSTKSYIKRLEKQEMDRDRLIYAVYDLALSSEGLSRLAGFGFTNSFGDRLIGNAEY